jgi:hypothetical protein
LQATTSLEPPAVLELVKRATSAVKGGGASLRTADSTATISIGTPA